jgi:hypothetical protein
MKEMKVEKTNRGFQIIKFQDRYGEECSLQQSSLADYEPPGTSALWFGVGGNRMHLDLHLINQILPHLVQWAANGHLYLKENK